MPCGDAYHTLGPHIIYSTTTSPQDREDLGGNGAPTSARWQWTQDSKSHFAPCRRLSDFLLKPVVGLG